VSATINFLTIRTNKPLIGALLIISKEKHDFVYRDTSDVSCVFDASHVSCVSRVSDVSDIFHVSDIYDSYLDLQELYYSDLKKI